MMRFTAFSTSYNDGGLFLRLAQLKNAVAQCDIKASGSITLKYDNKRPGPVFARIVLMGRYYRRTEVPGKGVVLGATGKDNCTNNALIFP